MTVFSRFRAFTRKYPLVRGMLSYGAMWPISSLVQQTIQGRDYTNYDYKKASRFMLYGTFFTAPTLYSWVKLSTYLWPQNTVRVAITKALVEQVSYGPAAMCCFFFGMTLLEGRGVNAGIEEIQHKFFPSYKVAICFWPILQTINFCLINERNRVPFTSVCSMVWTCFMAYMHQLEAKDMYTDEAPLAENT